jgi:hypothetical protein
MTYRSTSAVVIYCRNIVAGAQPRKKKRENFSFLVVANSSLMFEGESVLAKCGPWAVCTPTEETVKLNIKSAEAGRLYILNKSNSLKISVF